MSLSTLSVFLRSVAQRHLYYPEEHSDRTVNIAHRSRSSECHHSRYLLRIEHIALHDAYYFGGAQYYVACAQLEVTNGGNGSPGPLVSIPGVYNGYVRT